MQMPESMPRGTAADICGVMSVISVWFFVWTHKVGILFFQSGFPV
jgi:hypothetical protein